MMTRQVKTRELVCCSPSDGMLSYFSILDNSSVYLTQAHKVHFFNHRPAYTRSHFSDRFSASAYGLTDLLISSTKQRIKKNSYIKKPHNNTHFDINLNCRR